MKSDTYKTIKKPSQGIFKSKGSRFLSFAFPVTSIDDIKPILDEYRKKYHDARHHCYAYVIGPDKALWRANDDGEPSGTAGKPILGQINSFDLTCVLIIVVRYFGGTLLGTSGLINAYKSASYDAVINSVIIDCTVNEYYMIEFPYSSINSVMKIIRDENISQSDQVFEMECSLKINFRSSAREGILKRLGEIEKIKIIFIETK